MGEHRHAPFVLRFSKHERANGYLTAVLRMNPMGDESAIFLYTMVDSG